MRFSNLGLADPLVQATDALGYATPTPIQVKAIPFVLDGSDLIGCADTGTGKTAAFTLPVLDRLLRTSSSKSKAESAASAPHSRTRARALRALILTPTRELAVQIGESFERYGRFTPLRQTVVYGGVSQYQQVKAIRHGVDTLIATPGRLLDLIDQGHIELSRVEVLVLDEADRMLDMGFLPALKRIVALVPRQRQTLMFSATMPTEIRSIAHRWLRDPVAVDVAPIETPVERIVQSVYLVDTKHKATLLAQFLNDTPHKRTLVFSRTKHGADKIAKRLNQAGFYAAAIHGNKSQQARSRALAQFKGPKPPILVATDIAARGLDVTGVSHVVNYDLPEVPETYVHRIGRTARAGATGTAISFCAAHERVMLKSIERLINRSITVEPSSSDMPCAEPKVPARNNGGNHPAGVGPRRKSAKKSRQNSAPVVAEHNRASRRALDAQIPVQQNGAKPTLELSSRQSRRSRRRRSTASQ